MKATTHTKTIGRRVGELARDGGARRVRLAIAAHWRHGGVHLPGVAAQVIGVLAAAAWLDTTVWKGPLSSLSNGADFSVFMGAIVGGTLYWLLARHAVAREREPHPSAP